MAILTIFNHGTGFNRVKGSAANELVGWLHNHVQGNEARIDSGQPVLGNHIINEGPGSTAGGVVRPTEVNPMTGRDRSNETFKFGKGAGKRSSFARGFAGQDGGNVSAMSGNISGAGWDENVQRTVQIIQSLKFEGLYDVTQVNMVGWSRGAVTSIRIANLLYEVFGTSITCNIFGADPVAGQDEGLTRRDTRVLPPSVRNYVAVLSQNERRNSFAPQDMSRMVISDGASTNVCFLPMPGKHNEQVMGRSGVALTPEANITRNLAFAFLSHFGTAFNSRPAPAYISDTAMCSGYAAVVLGKKAGTYKDTSGFMGALVGMGLGRRDFATSAQMGRYVTGGKHGYFVNEHHRYCFQRAFGGLFRQIFGNTGARKGQLDAIGREDLTAIGGAGGDIARSLVGHGHLVLNGGTVQVHLGSGEAPATAGSNLWPRHLPTHA